MLFNTVIRRNSFKHSMDISFSWCHFILCIHHIFCYQCCYINEIIFYTWRVFPLDHNFNGYLLWQLFQWNYFLHLSSISTQPQLHWLFVMSIMSIKSFSTPGEYFNLVTIAMAYRLFRSTQSHYLNQCWFITNGPWEHISLKCVLKYNSFSYTQKINMSSAEWRWFCLDLNVLMKNMTNMPFIKPEMNYKERSYTSGTLWDNKIIDHSDVVGASPVGAAPTTSSLST